MILFLIIIVKVFWEFFKGRWMLEDGCWKMGVGRWMLEDGCWKMDVGRWMKKIDKCSKFCSLRAKGL